MRLWAVFGSKVSTVPSRRYRGKEDHSNNKHDCHCLVRGTCHTHRLTFQEFTSFFSRCYVWGNVWSFYNRRKQKSHLSAGLQIMSGSLKRGRELYSYISLFWLQQDPLNCHNWCHLSEHWLRLKTTGLKMKTLGVLNEIEVSLPDLCSLLLIFARG